MKRTLSLMSALMVAIGAFAQTTVVLPVINSDSGGSDGPITLPVVSSSDGGSGSSVAPPPVPSVMPDFLVFLSSRAALKAYAAESARSANVTLESTGMEGSWATAVQWEGARGQEAILRDIDNLRIDFRMVNPLDYVQAKAEIKNAEWETLFAASSAQTPQPIDSPIFDPAYRLPQMFFYFQMADTIPFKVDRSIKGGKIMYVNDDGKTVTTVDLQVRNGRVYFRTDMAGKGILILRDDLGNEFLYNLRNNGIRVPISHVQYTGSQSFIEGMPSFKNTTNINYRVWSWDGIGQNPTLEVSVNTAGFVSVTVQTTEGAKPIGCMVRLQGETNWIYWSSGNPDTIKPFLFPGTSYIVPVWDSNEFKEPEPYIPEKGVVGPSPIEKG